jgi:hypothetical protein
MQCDNAFKKTEVSMTVNFVHAVKARFVRWFSPSLETRSRDRRGDAERSLSEYESYHWGPGPGAWY